MLYAMMVGWKMALPRALPAFLLLVLASTGATLADTAGAQEGDTPAVSLDPLDAFAEHLLVDYDFSDEEALAETGSVRDLVPFIRTAFSANEDGAEPSVLSQEEASDLFEVLQDIERLQDSPADEDIAADKDVAQNEGVAAAKNMKMLTSVLTKLVSLATVKNMVSRKASAILDLLMTLKEKTTKVVNAAKRVAVTLKKLAKLQKRLIELADKFIKLLVDAMNIIKEQWQGAARRRQRSRVLEFFQFLLKWVGVAKEASLKKWALVKALYAVEDVDKASKYRPSEEEIITPGRLRSSEAAISAEPADGCTDDVSVSKSVPSYSLDDLFRDAEQARRIERDIAQSVWHQAAKCAQDGLVPLPFVRILLGES